MDERREMNMNEPLIIASSARTAALCLAAPGARHFLPARTEWRLSSTEGDERRGETATVVTLLHDLFPDTCYLFEAEGFAALEFRTSPCAGLVEAAAFSLTPDVALDDEEGADILMVKPAGLYLDIIRDVREATRKPLAAYQISGEYAQIQAAARLGWLDLARCRHESLLAIKRAGADMILTYFAKEMAAALR